MAQCAASKRSWKRLAWMKPCARLAYRKAIPLPSASLNWSGRNNFFLTNMSNRIFVTLFIIGLFIGCAPNHTAQPLRLNSTETSTPVAASESPTPEIMPTAPSGLSSKVAAFYYPWYGNPSVDGQWIHWTENNHFPSGDIASDYYP